ncbi:MAG: cyclic nucleotide-binding domain-containing protein [Elusimicrobiota bacterium]
MSESNIRLLQSLRLLKEIPEAELAELGKFLKPLSLNNGDIVFKEGSPGQSLYFISRGRIRISKKIKDRADPDLAILGTGDSFGEMAAIENAPRSAEAAALGSAEIFELAQEDLNRWLASHPNSAMRFFSRLVLVQSGRLRRTSSELSLIYDLSQLFLSRFSSVPEFMDQALERILSHLEGSWSAAAFIKNEFSGETECAAKKGAFEFPRLEISRKEQHQAAAIWFDPDCCKVQISGPQGVYGFVIFHSSSPLELSIRRDVGLALDAAARLMGAALENIRFRIDEILRARLDAARAHGPRL